VSRHVANSRNKAEDFVSFTRKDSEHERAKRTTVTDLAVAMQACDRPTYQCGSHYMRRSTLPSMQRPSSKGRGTGAGTAEIGPRPAECRHAERARTALPRATR